MPTYEWLSRFAGDYADLGPEQRAAFKAAVAKFVQDLKRGRGFRPGLRVKGVQGSPGIFELTWAQDGRATFEYGPSRVEGQPHVIWRRIGTHSIFDRP